MATITITLDVGDDLDGKLELARRLVDHMEEAARLAKELAGDAPLPPVAPSGVRQTPARPTADRPPPEAVAKTNGHGPKRQRGPLTSPARARRYTDEEKAAVVARAAEIGVSKAAEEHDVAYGSVKRWIASHPKEHAVAEPIRGTPPAVGESREDWEARRRAAAGAAL